MQKKLLIAMVLLLISLQGLQAKIFRIGYLGIPVTGVDFANLSTTVINAAAAGDTIQIYQNNANTSNTTVINKKLVFLGFGFLLDKNPGLQATPLADYSISLYFIPGSEGSVIQGLNLANIYIGVSNVTVSRCRITNHMLLAYNGQTGQSPPVSNINVFGNYFNVGLTDQGEANNVLISNNIFLNPVTLDNSSGLFLNNITLIYTLTLNSFIIKNNIISGQCISSSGSTYSNNLFSVTSCPAVTGPGNQFGVNMSNVFANWNNGSITADNQLALKAGSPAIGAGIDVNGNPTDAGVFGGGSSGFAYKLSGIPPIPAIYQLTAPSQTANNNPYTITVSVRSNN